jgi:hypothetical protein
MIGRFSYVRKLHSITSHSTDKDIIRGILTKVTENVTGMEHRLVWYLLPMSFHPEAEDRKFRLNRSRVNSMCWPVLELRTFQINVWRFTSSSLNHNAQRQNRNWEKKCGNGLPLDINRNATERVFVWPVVRFRFEPVLFSSSNLQLGRLETWTIVDMSSIGSRHNNKHSERNSYNHCLAKVLSEKPLPDRFSILPTLSLRSNTWPTIPLRTAALPKLSLKRHLTYRCLSESPHDRQMSLRTATWPADVCTNRHLTGRCLSEPLPGRQMSLRTATWPAGVCPNRYLTDNCLAEPPPDRQIFVLTQLYSFQ